MAEIVENANLKKGGGDRLEKKRRSEKRKGVITKDSRTRFSKRAANCERESFLVVREEFSLGDKRKEKKKKRKKEKRGAAGEIFGEAVERVRCFHGRLRRTFEQSTHEI